MSSPGGSLLSGAAQAPPEHIAFLDAGRTPGGVRSPLSTLAVLPAEVKSTPALPGGETAPS